jgi:hypothetical protein
MFEISTCIGLNVKLKYRLLKSFITTVYMSFMNSILLLEESHVESKYVVISNYTIYVSFVWQYLMSSNCIKYREIRDINV